MQRRTIGVDGSRAFVDHRTGTERYSFELLRAMSRLDIEEDVTVYTRTGAVPEPWPFLGRPLRLTPTRLWTIAALSREMLRRPPDLLFVPAHVVPPVHPPSVVTIHDLGYIAQPDCHDARQRRYLEWSTRWSCQTASGIIAVSATTAADIVEHLKIPSGRITVIHHGVSPHFRPADSNEIATCRTTFQLERPFVLAVGTIHPRKNLVRLIEMFERVAMALPELGLVIVGRSGWNAEHTIARVRSSSFRNRIRMVGYVSDEAMPALYSASEVLVFPSLYEGFGMPALEAMACGTPVIASNRGALPEICGDAAILVDPLDIGQMAEATWTALTDSAVRESLISKGFARARAFDWETCATRTLAFLRANSDNS